MKDQLAQQVQVYQDSRELGSEFHIEATAAEGADLEHIKQVVLEEIARLQKDGPTAAELARVKAATEAGLPAPEGEPRPSRRPAQCVSRGLRRGERFDRDLARRLAPTAESVHAAGRAPCSARAAWTCACCRSRPRRPPPASTSGPDNLPDRSRPSRRWPMKLTLKNGQPLYVVSKPGSGLFSGHVIVDGGERLLDADQAGLASLSATLVTRGAGKLDATAYADAVTTLGARIQATSGTNAMTLVGVGPHLAPRRDAGADGRRAPAPDRSTPADFDREKELALAGIRARGENANRVAQAVGRAALFGAGRPARPSRRRIRGHGGEADARGRRAVDAETVRPGARHAGVRRRLHARADQGGAGQGARRWKGGEATAAAPPAPVTAPKPGLLLVDRPGAPQTVISI